MSKRPIPSVDVEKFLPLLRKTLPDHESIASAIPIVYVALKKDYPHWPHDILRLRHFVTWEMSADDRKNLTRLCKNQLDPLQADLDYRDRINAISSNAESRVGFLLAVVAGGGRPELAHKYGISLASIPIIFTECIIQQRLPGTSRPSFKRLSTVQRILSSVASQREDWAVFNNFTVDEHLQLFLPPDGAWPIPPSEQEILKLNALLEADRQKTLIQKDFAIATSWGAISRLEPQRVRTGSGKKLKDLRVDG